MNYPHLDISVDRLNAIEGALEVARKVKSDWSDEDLTTKTFTDGITNVLVGVRLTANPDLSEMLLVRIHGNNTELIIDRKRELRTIHALQTAGCCPPLHCTFNNGICYGFAPGLPVDLRSVRDPNVVPLVVKAMAKFHSVNASDSEAKREPMLFTTMESWMKLVPTAFQDDAKQKGYLHLCKKLNIEQELSMLKGRLLQLHVPIVFCHNDLLLGNVIHDSNRDCVSFIDFEYGGFNFRSFDIANHFCEYPGTENVDYKYYPGKEFQLQWIRLYLEETARLQGSAAVPSAEEVERVYVEVNQFALASHMFWGIWAVIQAAYSEIDFDYMGYAHDRLDEYLRRRDEFLALAL